MNLFSIYFSKGKFGKSQGGLVWWMAGNDCFESHQSIEASSNRQYLF